MPVKKLKQFLDENNVKYVSVSHSAAYTAQEIAASAHIPGKELAKTVILKVKGELAMAILPASFKVDFDQMKEALGTQEIELAAEEEFKYLFFGLRSWCHAAFWQFIRYGCLCCREPY